VVPSVRQLVGFDLTSDAAIDVDVTHADDEKFAAEM
jgi:hypothetical protein